MLNWMSKVEKGRAGLARNREKIKERCLLAFLWSKSVYVYNRDNGADFYQDFFYHSSSAP